MGVVMVVTSVEKVGTGLKNVLRQVEVAVDVVVVVEVWMVVSSVGLKSLNIEKLTRHD